MATIVQSGQLNIAALTVAGVYIQIIPPQLLINGVPTNVVGAVGTATWGPDNAAAVVGSYASFAAQFGNMVPRTYDLGTHVWNAYQQGTQVVFQCVRATDGTDTAASVVIQTNCLTLTSKWTGSNGNNQQVTIGPGAAANSQRATLLTPGVLPEVFDSILQGVAAITPTPGTGYTSVPALLIGSAPAGGVNASAGASLVVVGTPTVVAGGTENAIDDVLTLPNGVQLKVLTVSSGAVTTVSVVNAGQITGASTPIPTNPVAVTSTTGSGSGATFDLTWGLGPVVGLIPGSGYTAAPSCTITGGGDGSGGSYTAAISYWVNIASAINNGQGALRGPSANFIASLGSGTSTPTAQTYSLSGGTDGANVTTSQLVGNDTLPYSGMYALGGLGCSIGLLADCDDPTTWPSQISFGLQNGIYMIAVTASGDTLSNAESELSNAGIDSYAMKVMFGDWVYFLDTVNNVTRLASPQGFVAGLLGNLAPNQSTLNKQVYGIVGTQKSQTGVAYQQADLQTLVNARMDVIATPCPGGTYFGCQNGHNSSSNSSIHGDNYTRMTNFLASTLASGMGIYVGTLGTPGQATALKGTIDAFMSNVQYSAGLIGDPTNPNAPPAWQSSVDLSMIGQGVEQATLQVTYQGIVEELVISIQGGQTVTLTNTTTPTSG